MTAIPKPAMYKPMPIAINLPERGIDLIATPTIVSSITINIVSDIAIPITDTNWCDFQGVQEYRSQKYNQIHPPHSAFTLKSLAAMKLGYGITPERLALIIDPELREFVQRHTMWYWQIDAFNPIRSWDGKGTLIRETEVAVAPNLTLESRDNCTDYSRWMRHGYYREWNAKGLMISNREYRYDTLHGKQITYVNENRDTGSVYAYEQRFVNDVCIGNEYSWDSTGRLLSKTQYYGGAVSRRIHWEYKRERVVEWRYVNDLREKLIYCIYTGRMMSHENMFHGSRHGSSRTWNRDGMLTKAEFFIDNFSHGDYIIWSYHSEKYILVGDTDDTTLHDELPLYNAVIYDDVAIGGEFITEKPIKKPFTCWPTMLDKYQLNPEDFDEVLAEYMDRS